MFEATRILQRKGKNQPLLIYNGDGITTNEEEQVKHITSFFSTFFHDKSAEDIPEITPCKMRKPFSTDEIQLAIQSLRNNKTPCIDGITAEPLKHGPTILYETIANILNKVSETGNIPTE